jgi:recombination protein RecT
MIDQLKKQVALALPRHLNADRMARIALTEFRKNPKLGECDPTTVFASVIVAAQLGLEPGVLGQAFLVPYMDRRAGTLICQFIPGWQGLVDLAQRSARSSVWTGAVFEGDYFKWALGSEPFIRHKPKGEDDPAKITHVYACGRVKGAEYPIVEVWPVNKVWKHRQRYNKVGMRHYSYENQEMYARKLPLLQVLKYMPKSPELALAVDLEHAASTDGNRLDIHDAIEGTFNYVPDSSREPPPSQEPAQASSGDEPPAKESMSARAKRVLREKEVATRPEGGKEESQGSMPFFDPESALAAIKSVIPGRLRECWQQIFRDFIESKRALPNSVSIEALRKSASVDELIALWKCLVTDFRDAELQTPLEVEAVYHELIEVFESRPNEPS